MSMAVSNSTKFALLTLLFLALGCCGCSGYFERRNPQTYSSQVVSTAIIQGLQRLIGTVNAARTHPEGSSFSRLLDLGRLGTVEVKFGYLNRACLYSGGVRGGLVYGAMIRVAFRAILEIYRDTMIREGAAYFYAEVGRISVEYFQVTGPTRSTSFSPSYVNNTNTTGPAFAQIDSSNMTVTSFSSSSPTTEEESKTPFEFELQDIMYPPGSTKDCYMFGSTLISGPAQHPHTVLPNGVYLESPNQRVTLEMQPDCNLVTYNIEGKAIWSTRTDGRGTGCQLYMQADGNLVVYNDKSEAVWSSGTNCEPWPCVVPAVATIQDDTNFVIYQTDTLQSLWASANERW